MTPDPEGANPAAAYAARLNQARSALVRLDQRGAWLANFRGATFIGALAAAGLTLYGRLGHAEGWGLVALLVVSYVALAQWHQRVLTAEGRQRLRVSLNERGLARLDGHWRAFPGRGERFGDGASGHPYVPDLDVFGQGSLFQLIDESGTRAGEEKLASWLSTPAAAAQLAQRQDAVRELVGLLDFRQSLVVECRLAAKDKADPARFIAWAEGGDLLAGIRWARPLAWALPLAFVAAATLASQDVVTSWVPWGVFFALVATVAATRAKLGALYEAVALSEGGFVRFENALGAMESQPFSDASLKSLAGRLSAPGDRASAALTRFSRLFGFAELRQSSQLHAVLNVFTLWDLHWLFALEGWRRAHGRAVRAWFDALAELEALSSLAGFAHARPSFCFPTVSAGAPRLEAKALGHPLLDVPVRNDLVLSGPGFALLVTGSNMSGKTTLLRAMGSNAVLALAGAPTCAEVFSCSDLAVLTGMRVKDSLEQGVSYFYAEVQRIKMILESARASSGRALFLLDEILLGTNARERQVASREILRLLLETGAIGAVATHDLTLSAVGVHNVHFEDQIVEGQMTFDYRLRDGLVQGTNALRVLRQAGIDVHEPKGL